MARSVVVDGPGTYSVGSFRFQSGRTPCEDEGVLEAVRQGPDWVFVDENGAGPLRAGDRAILGPLTREAVTEKPICECGREFQTTHGLAAHRRVMHEEG